MSANEKRERRIKDVLMFTKIATAVMMAMCVIALILSYYICAFGWAIDVKGAVRAMNIIPEKPAFGIFMAIYFICIGFAMVILVGVWKLLKNLGKNEVFVRNNTKLLDVITIGCAGITVFCFICGLIVPSTVFIGFVGLFMGLIVQCVKVLMDKAIDIREELDLTI